MGLIFVDCEASGPCPAPERGWHLTELGAVDFQTWWLERRWETFHGVLRSRDGKTALNDPFTVFSELEAWLARVRGKGGVSAVSDNPAFDWQWVNHGFWTTLGRNPLGHSARRISDFYAGLTGDFHNTQTWKRLRRTRHDHHPVHDAMGNVEAFERLLAGER